ncbi:hypothetical protein M153_54220001331, partial [Pseudoloma neurophilia]
KKLKKKKITSNEQNVFLSYEISTFLLISIAKFKKQIQMKIEHKM